MFFYLPFFFKIEYLNGILHTAVVPEKRSQKIEQFGLTAIISHLYFLF